MLLLTKVRSLYIKIMNSVVVVGFYYGFTSTFFSIGLSYLFLLQAHIQSIREGEKESEEEVSAETGFLLGRLLIFVSIYDTSLDLALDGEIIITLLVLFFFLLLYDTYSYENLSKPTEQTLMLIKNPSTPSIFLINLLFQLLNNIFYPSSSLARLATIYTFFYYNKMSFVMSSFVGWLIGQILLIKCVRFVLVWLYKNYLVRFEDYFSSKQYLLDKFRFFQSVERFCNILIFSIMMYVQRFCSILILFICLCVFDRMPLPRLNFQIPRLTFQIQAGTQEEKAVEPNSQEAGTQEEKAVEPNLQEKRRFGNLIIEEMGPSGIVFTVDTTSQIRALCEKAGSLEYYEDFKKLFEGKQKKPERNIDCHLSFRKRKGFNIYDSRNPKNIESPLTKGKISIIDNDNSESLKLEEK